MTRKGRIYRLVLTLAAEVLVVLYLVVVMLAVIFEWSHRRKMKDEALGVKQK